MCVGPVLEEDYLVNLTILLDIDLPYQTKVKKEQLLACLGYSVAFIGSGWGQRFLHLVESLVCAVSAWGRQLCSAL